MSATVTSSGEVFISEIAAGSVAFTNGLFADQILIAYVDGVDPDSVPSVVQQVPDTILHAATINRSGLDGDSVSVFNAFLRAMYQSYLAPTIQISG